MLSCYGALDRFELQPGQQVVVDTNHMVAFAESVQMELTRASDSFMKSAKTGEGFVFVFTGPGELMMQSATPTKSCSTSTGTCRPVVTDRRLRPIADQLTFSEKRRGSPPTVASCADTSSGPAPMVIDVPSTCSAM